MTDASSQEEGKGRPETPLLAWLATAYHVAILIACVKLMFSLQDGNPDGGRETLRQTYALLAGAMGGTFTASRWVIYAVRHGRYDSRRLLWQLATPIYSGVLGWIAVIAVRSGILTLVESPVPLEPRYTFFVITFAFLVGIASESFLKRLIMAAETIFGERGDLEREDVYGRVKEEPPSMREGKDEDRK